jgi:cytidyltransferase-like protein
VVVSGSFDDLRSRHVRLLEEASKLGDVHVLIWPDETVLALEGKPPKFPQKERQYLVQAMRYVKWVSLAPGLVEPDALPDLEQLCPHIWVVAQADETPEKRDFCRQNGIIYKVFSDDDLSGFPQMQFDSSDENSEVKKVVVTGCFDWLHSGHVRFFEEVSELGELYVVVGNDENVRFLKGEGHPLFSQEERRYMVQAVRYVHAALITSGKGWMDAEPEIDQLQPDIYAVNQDGDKPEKRTFCNQHHLEYVVLQRKPKEGLPKRESTVLRGF